MGQWDSARPAHRVPALIKRNTALFALSQCFTGAGMQFAYGLGPLDGDGGLAFGGARRACRSG